MKICCYRIKSCKKFFINSVNIFTESKLIKNSFINSVNTFTESKV